MGFDGARQTTIKGRALGPGTADATSGNDGDGDSDVSETAPAEAIHPASAAPPAAADLPPDASDNSTAAVSMDTPSDVQLSPAAISGDWRLLPGSQAATPFPAPHSTPASAGMPVGDLGLTGKLSALELGSVPRADGGSVDPDETEQGWWEKPAGTAAAGAQEGGGVNGRGSGDDVAADTPAREKQHTRADRLYIWCCEAGGGFLEYSHWELREWFAAKVALPPALQQLYDLRY
ncbi:MAG: hypothetical protein WDW38_003367 [Sanguina aurantia]